MKLPKGVKFSAAAARYFDNFDDIAGLLAIHKRLGGLRPGRRNLDALNKAGIVLNCAFREAFCGDLADEALTFLVASSTTPDALPLSLRKLIARELKADAYDLSPWKIAGDAWKPWVLDRARGLREERNKLLNTPKSDQIAELFAKTLGLPDVTGGWNWKKVSVPQARKKLDAYVSLRGDIAHRGVSSTKPVWVRDVRGFTSHVINVVAHTEVTVSSYLEQQTGLRPWH